MSENNWGFFEKIGKGLFNIGDKSIDFVTDIAQGAVSDSDEYDGVADTIWGAFNDNVLGEGGALQSAIGPDGIGGAIIEQATVAPKAAWKHVISPTLEGTQWAYQNIIDDNLSGLMTMASMMSGDEGAGYSGVFDTDLWSKAFEIGQSRSLGQSISLAVFTENILDEEEVSKHESTALHTLFSGTTDLVANVILDPLMLVGSPAMAGVRYTRNGRHFANGGKFVESRGHQLFDKKINSLADEIGDTLKGDEFTDALTGKILNRFGSKQKSSGLGVHKGMTPEVALALAKTHNKPETRKLVIRLAMGDTEAVQTVIKMSDEWAAALQKNGVLTNLAENETKIANLRAELRTLEKQTGGNKRTRKKVEGKKSAAKKSIEEFENEIQTLTDDAAKLFDKAEMFSESLDGAGELFNIAFSLRTERIRGLHRFADAGEDLTSSNAFFDAMNQDAHLITGTVDEALMAAARNAPGETLQSAARNEVLGGFLSESQGVNRLLISSLTTAPRISMVGDLGYGAAQYAQKIPLLGTGGTRVIQVFREKIPQQLINWAHTDQAYTQFSRMIRDASRVSIKGEDGKKINLFEEITTTVKNAKGVDTVEKLKKINADDLLGQWVRLDLPQRKEFLKETIQVLNDRVIHLYGNKLPEGITSEKLTEAMRGMKKALVDAETTLRESSQTARVRDKTLTLDFGDENYNITRRVFDNITPQQLEESALIPRYDKIADAFRQGAPKRSANKATDGLNGIMSAWKKSVLLRPAWPIRVLSDELARSAASIGGMATLRGAMEGMSDLRVAWFKREGLDVIEPTALKAMRDDLVKANVPLPEVDDLGELFIQYEKLNGDDAVKNLYKKIIGKEYGTRRTTKRAGAYTALGALAAGPAGAAAGASLYTYYARRTMTRLARREVAETFYTDLRRRAASNFLDESKRIEKAVGDKVYTLEEGKRLLTDLKEQTRLLETQGRTLTNSLEATLGKKPKTNKSFADEDGLDEATIKARKEITTNFDQVGKMMNEARVGGYTMGPYKFGNEFGDDPFTSMMHRNTLSASRSTAATYESAARNSKKLTVSQADGRNYDYGEKGFDRAFDAKINRQFKPEGAAYGNVFQDFSRMFWAGKSDDEIVRFLEGPRAATLLEAIPQLKNQDLELYVRQIRYKLDNSVPNIDEFGDVRAKLAKGDDISWDNDIVPVLKDMDPEGNVDNAVKKIKLGYNKNFEQFGDTKNISIVEESIETGNIIKQVIASADKLMRSWGTLPVDNLSRSTVFAGHYRQEIARLMQMHRDSAGLYTLTPQDLKSMENAARRVALGNTQELLYDLAERTRFGEMVGLLMPFYGAWQEVITRWSGLAAQNPVFVGRGIKYFQAIKGEDEDGNDNFVFRLPEGLLNKELAGKKVFGKLGSLGFTQLKLSPDSISMISAGTPGFGPLVTMGASELLLKDPSLQEAMDWLLPYGASEGKDVVDRLIQQVEPTFIRRLSGVAINNAERQKLLAQVSIDLAVEYEGMGNPLETETDVDAFVDEAMRRAKDIMYIRALAGLGMPFAFQVQSPYNDVIEAYRKKSTEKGFEFATEWLMENHSNLWAITARRTNIKGVASGTLEGEANYQEHQTLIRNNEEIGDFITGKVGTSDVGFEFNYAVYKKEIADGRRVRATPEEIMRRPEETRGWNQWRNVTNLVYEQLDRRGASPDGSASLRANSNNDLQLILSKAKIQIASEHPFWWEEYNKGRDNLYMKKVIEGFRNVVDSGELDYRPEVPLLEIYLNRRKIVEDELRRRGDSSNEPDKYSIGHRENQDLENLWGAIQTDLRQNTDFDEIFIKYLENDNVDRKTWLGAP